MEQERSTASAEQLISSFKRHSRDPVLALLLIIIQCWSFSVNFCWHFSLSNFLQLQQKELFRYLVLITSHVLHFLLGKEHILRPGKHPHLKHHRTAVCRAVVPGHPAQRAHQGRWRRRGEGHQRIPTPQIPLPDHEHPAHGALQGVCRVCHQ